MDALFCNQELILQIQNGNLKNAERLISEGANVNYIDYNAMTPLMYAIETKNEELIKLLLDKGANINAQNIYGKTPLMYALEMNNQELVELLIDQGADINAKDINDKTTLMYAISNGSNFALQCKDINQKDDDENTALSLAASHKKLDLFISLIDRGASIDAQFIKNNEEMMAKYLAKKLGVNHGDINSFKDLSDKDMGKFNDTKMEAVCLILSHIGDEKTKKKAKNISNMLSIANRKDVKLITKYWNALCLMCSKVFLFGDYKSIKNKISKDGKVKKSKKQDAGYSNLFDKSVKKNPSATLKK